MRENRLIRCRVVVKSVFSRKSNESARLTVNPCIDEEERLKMNKSRLMTKNHGETSPPVLKTSKREAMVMMILFDVY